MASPRPIRAAERLLEAGPVASLVLPADVRVDLPEQRVGRFAPNFGRWQLPRQLGDLVYLGDAEAISYSMWKSAARRRVRSIVCIGSNGVERAPLAMEGPLQFARASRAELRAVVRRLPAGRLVDEALEERSAEVGLRQLLRRLPHAWRREDDGARRVALCVGSLCAGGAERQAVNLARGLAEHGDDCCVVLREASTAADWFFGPGLAERGIAVVDAASPHTWGGHGSDTGSHCRLLLPLDLWVDIRAFARVFQALRPHVVHAYLDPINGAAGLAALLVGVPRVVLSARNVAPPNFMLHRPWFRAAYRALLADERAVLATNSHAGRADYARWLGVRDASIPVIENGASVPRVTPEAVESFRVSAGIPVGARLVGTAGRLAEEKNPLAFVEVAAALANRFPDVRFVHAGSGPMETEVRALISRLGLSGRLSLLGQRSDTAVIMQALDVFVLMSRKEGLPNVLIEAQQLGVPVVSTDAGGAREAFVPGQTGTVVPVADVAAVAAAVAEWLDRPWSAAQREAIAARARDRFSMDTMVRRMRELHAPTPP